MSLRPDRMMAADAETQARTPTSLRDRTIDYKPATATDDEMDDWEYAYARLMAPRRDEPMHVCLYANILGRCAVCGARVAVPVLDQHAEEARHPHDDGDDDDE